MSIMYRPSAHLLPKHWHRPLKNPSRSAATWKGLSEMPIKDVILGVFLGFFCLLTTYVYNVFVHNKKKIRGDDFNGKSYTLTSTL